MKVHLRLYRIDGLNVDSSGFNWKNRLILTNSDKPNWHIATAYVKIPRPLPTSPTDIYQGIKDQAEGQRVVTLFLSCYGLVTNKYFPKIDLQGGSGFPIDEDKISLENLHLRLVPNERSGYGTMSIDETMKCLEETMPFFEKVMEILEQQKNDHKLDVALIMFYRSGITMEFMEGFIDMITALEALYSKGGTGSYKIALRAAVFTENDYVRRRELFDHLRKIYRSRNKLVHGDDYL